MNNFVSGSLILFERKIQVGDAVQIGDVSGQVQQLGMRACTVRTWEGAEVIVPNASLTADKVTNWTLSDRRRRIDVAVAVAHGTPPAKVLDVLLGVARAHPQVLADPEPTAHFQVFGDSALLFALYAWTDRFDLWGKTRSELNAALYEALREAGIEIPSPSGTCMSDTREPISASPGRARAAKPDQGASRADHHLDPLTRTSSPPTRTEEDASDGH